LKIKKKEFHKFPEIYECNVFLNSYFWFYWKILLLKRGSSNLEDGFLEVPAVSYFSVFRRVRRLRKIPKPILETSFKAWCLLNLNNLYDLRGFNEDYLTNLMC
jgi:hypothetical protein